MLLTQILLSKLIIKGRYQFKREEIAYSSPNRIKKGDCYITRSTRGQFKVEYDFGERERLLKIQLSKRLLDEYTNGIYQQQQKKVEQKSSD